MRPDVSESKDVRLWAALDDAYGHDVEDDIEGSSKSISMGRSRCWKRWC